MPDAIAFVCENFGPTHADRCETVAVRFAGKRAVIGIELAGRSHTYDWQPEARAGFAKRTLFPAASIDRIGWLRRLARTVRACLAARDIFFCHYEHPATFLAALVLRAAGRRVYVMNDSKFDDKPRVFWRERAKRVLHLPYLGGIAAGARSKDYMRSLGVPAGRIFEFYDNISVARIRRLAKAPPAPAGAPFEARHFTIVARLVPKKNLLTAIAAFALYCNAVRTPRSLVLVGSGPMEAEIRARIAALGLQDRIHLTGFLESEGVCEILSRSLALLMPSTEEQFGIAALEAIAMGVPVIVSENCGVRDSFVREGVNGFVVEANDAACIGSLLTLIGSDEARWRAMAAANADFAEQGDAGRFAESVEALVGAAARPEGL